MLLSLIAMEAAKCTGRTRHERPDEGKRSRERKRCGNFAGLIGGLRLGGILAALSVVLVAFRRFWRK
jgi:hypothetical protein